MKRHIKHGHLPGDVSKGLKILMLEKGVTRARRGGGRAFDKPAKGVKQYRKRILMKERAVLKERSRALIDSWNQSFE